MGLFDRFKKRDNTVICTNLDFWKWFSSKSDSFYDILNKQNDVENNFINAVSPKITQLNDGFSILAGMLDDNTAELIVTADGDIKLFPLISTLINEAPEIANWKFTSLKPPMEDTGIEFENGLNFNKENILFYSDENERYPDEIDLKVIFADKNKADKETIEMGVFLFLENYLGELNFATDIDLVSIIDKSEATKELIPIEKIKSFIEWRKKEFVEKYNTVYRNTENDSYSGLELISQEGLPIFAIINKDIVKWEHKVSHPWMANIRFKYDGTENNGLPLPDKYDELNKIEDQINNSLKDTDGYLNLGRVTGENEKELFFACKDYQKPALAIDEIVKLNPNEEIEFEIYLDKYWKSLELFYNEIN